MISKVLLPVYQIIMLMRLQLAKQHQGIAYRAVVLHTRYIIVRNLRLNTACGLQNNINEVTRPGKSNKKIEVLKDIDCAALMVLKRIMVTSYRH